MAKQNNPAVIDEANTLELIKKLGVKAMFSDDELYDELVLKGGNAMDLIHRLSSRASVDLDFSMQHDFPDGVEAFRSRVERALTNTFRQNGYEVFDVKMIEKPTQISEDMKDFWGGYGVEFKLITSDLYQQHANDVHELRKHAIRIGQGQKFLIDISRFEYTLGKQEAELDGFRIYVYSPEMIVCEKLRAICQQLPEYGQFIKRSRPGSARARDFIDIYVLVSTLLIDVSSEKNQELLTEMFKTKKVPLEYLGKISDQHDFHQADFPAVRATVKEGTNLRGFDFYFKFVLDLVEKLKPLWNV